MERDKLEITIRQEHNDSFVLEVREGDVVISLSIQSAEGEPETEGVYPLGKESYVYEIASRADYRTFRQYLAREVLERLPDERFTPVEGSAYLDVFREMHERWEMMKGLFIPVRDTTDWR